MARRRKGLFGNIVRLSVLGLAVFGGWTLYQQNKRDADRLTSKAVKTGRDVAHKLSKNLANLNVKGGSVWVCYFSATEKALETCCAKKNSCDGAGTIGKHPYSREEAYKVGEARCIADYGECEFDTCRKE